MTFFCPTTSDSANQSVAAQWPVLQNEMVSSAGSGSDWAAMALASAGDTKMAVPGLNHLLCSRLSALWMVPGTLAVGALTSPRKKIGRASCRERVCQYV